MESEPRPSPSASSPAGGGGADVELFLRLFGAHRQRLFRYILAILPSLHDAEDVLQETNVVLWRKFGEFEPGTNFLAWATRVAQLEVLKYRRHHARARNLLALDEDLVAQLAVDVDESSEQLDRVGGLLEQCVQKLSAADRELVRLCYATRATAKAVAEQLGRPANSVYKSLGRIRQSLLECVKRSQRLAEWRGGAV